MSGDKRQLGNWLDSFTEWVLPRSIAPESMVRWTGLFALSAVMKRRVYWPMSLLGGYEIFPNLYVIFVADPGVVTKSTTVGYAERLLNDPALTGLSAVTFAGTVTSHSKLLQSLSDSSDASVAVVSSEFSSLIQTTPEQMYEVLIDIYDNKSKFNWDTWAHGQNVIKNPSVCLFAATTPAWISGQPPAYFVEGGFASRVVFVYEEEPRQRKMYYDHLNFADFEVLGTKLAHDLEIISRAKGEFKHDSKKTMRYAEDWYINLPPPSDPRLKGFRARIHTHTHKVAMLLSLCERDDCIVTREHWDEATKMLGYVEKKLSKVFTTLGINPFAILMDKIAFYIEERGEVKLNQVAARFYAEGATIDQLKSALMYLKVAGRIRTKGNIEDPSFIPATKKAS